MEAARPGTRRTAAIAVLLFLSLAGAYASLVVYLDHTNQGTTNGLWKAPWINAWETGTGRPVDTGDLLYLPAYGYLCRLIPDQAVSYGVPGRVVTYRKMALLNAAFSALASCMVFLLALRLLHSVGAALAVVTAHAAAGFVLLQSVNSEDVMPAYAFFLAATLCLFEYVVRRKIYLLALCACLLVLTALFHWTLFAPGAVALGSVQLALVLRRKHPVWLIWAFPLICLGMLGLGALAVHNLHPGLESPFREILFPGKATPNGWSGFAVDKLFYLLIGVGNYFSGAHHLSFYREAFQSPYLEPMIVSWLVLLLAAGDAIVTVASRQAGMSVRLLAGFSLVLFGAGELINVYVQPQDPQCQLQPMFLCVAAVIVLLAWLRPRLTPRRFRLAAAALAAAFLANGAWNAAGFSESRGLDSSSVIQVRELASTFPPAQFTKVSHIYEAWNTWWYFEYSGGDYQRFDAEEIHLLTPFTAKADLGGRDAAAIVRERVQRVFAAGRRVVACALWTQGRDEFAGTMTAVIDAARAEAFYDDLRPAFSLGRSWRTSAGRFVELLPNRERVVELPQKSRSGAGLF